MKHASIKTSILIAVSTVALACSSSNNAASTGKPDAGPGGSTGGSASGAGGTAGGSSTSGGATSVGGAGVGGGTAANCDTSTCTGKKVFGTALAACCIDASTCGVQAPAQFGGGCLPLSTISNLPTNIPDGGFTLPEGGFNFTFPDGGGPFGPPETIVLDPSCPDTAGAAGAAKGCCDKAGVCGAAVTQLKQCLTAADVRKIGGGAFSFDAGPEKSCTYPK